VRYAASLVADVFDAPVAPAGPLAAAPPFAAANGSWFSSAGAALGEDVLRLAAARLDLPAGEARRESVLRNADLRFGAGGGTKDASSGSGGSRVAGCESRSLLWSSTTSSAVRVSVRLCVGAARAGSISADRRAGAGGGGAHS
jgi:hypothetical protein